MEILLERCDYKTKKENDIVWGLYFHLVLESPLPRENRIRGASFCFGSGALSEGVVIAFLSWEI